MNGQIYSYGYQPADSTGGTLLSQPINTATSGNTDLRVPFIGYSPNSVFWHAIGGSGQPYNVYDFSGSVGSIYYSANDFITNPIVPLAAGFTPQSATQPGNPGATPPILSLNVNAFAIPQLQPGQMGDPPCGPTATGTIFCDTVENTFSNGGRDIFRGPMQPRLNFSIVKLTKLTERFHAPLRRAVLQHLQPSQL